MPKSSAWQRAEGKDPEGGLNEKGRASLRAEGKNIKRPVKKAEAAKSPAAAKAQDFILPSHEGHEGKADIEENSQRSR
jgi:hypothetical protein